MNTTTFANHFTHGAAQSLGDTAITYTLTAVRWGVLAVDRVHALATHPRTIRAAKVAVWGIYVGAVISYALGQTVRIYAQCWVDAEVSAALEFDDVDIEMPCSFYSSGEKYWSYGEDCYVQQVPLSVARSFHWEEDWELMEALEAEDNRVRIREVNPLPVVVAPVPALAEMTGAQLRQRAIAHNAALPAGDPRRIAKAARLTKGEALRALAG